MEFQYSQGLPAAAAGSSSSLLANQNIMIIPAPPAPRAMIMNGIESQDQLPHNFTNTTLSPPVAADELEIDPEFRYIRDARGIPPGLGDWGVASPTNPNAGQKRREYWEWCRKEHRLQTVQEHRLQKAHESRWENSEKERVRAWMKAKRERKNEKKRLARERAHAEPPKKYAKQKELADESHRAWKKAARGLGAEWAGRLRAKGKKRVSQVNRVLWEDWEEVEEEVMKSWDGERMEEVKKTRREREKNAVKPVAEQVAESTAFFRAWKLQDRAIWESKRLEVEKEEERARRKYFRNEQRRQGLLTSSSVPT